MYVYVCWCIFLIISFCDIFLLVVITPLRFMITNSTALSDTLCYFLHEKKKKNPWCCNIEVNRKCWVLNIEQSKQQFQQTFHISKTKYSKGTQIHNLPLEIWKDKIKQLNFYLSTKLCDLNFGGGCCFQFRLHVLKKSEN